MQILKYKWQDFLPRLVLRGDDGNIRQTDLIGNDISLAIGKKMCTGFSRDGKLHPCRSMRETEDRICNECKLEDDYFFCIRCDGSQCINPKKRGECEKNYYYMYLAAFGPLLKVGISHEFRLMERLVEQGADFGAKIARVRDGKTVREMEQSIKHELRIVDRVTGGQKQEMLFGNPNLAVANIFKAVSLLKANGFAGHMNGTEIYDLREFYRLGSVISQPEKFGVQEGARLEGHVIAAKGNILVLQKDRGFFSVNAHDLLGREVAI